MAEFVHFLDIGIWSAKVSVLSSTLL